MRVTLLDGEIKTPPINVSEVKKWLAPLHMAPH